ncbi:hypothetical protein J6S37_00595 [Candidatus Saccharibacteria bacterium]|nr:hypothetical protein [Candidatus Saccharibacteria bacterium]
MDEKDNNTVAQPNVETGEETLNTKVEESVKNTTTPLMAKSPDETLDVEKSLAEEPVAPKESVAPDTINEPEKKKVSKAVVATIILLVILVLVASGVGIWYFFFRTPEGEPQDDQIDITPTSPTASKLALKGNNISDFDLTFLKQNNNSNNIVYSPLSIKYALNMLADAANGNSKTQITNLLGDYKPKAYLNSANRSLANAMFVRTDSTFSNLMKSSYTDTIKTKYNASVVYDSFESPDNANGWVNDETLGIIDDVFNDDNFNAEKDFALVNALAIDMQWNNQLQCTSDGFNNRFNGEDSGISCKHYSVKYAHENYSESISIIEGDADFSKISFNEKDGVVAAEIGASANRYDIIKELGEEYIRETVQKEYEKAVQEDEIDPSDFDLDTYMEELAKNYGTVSESTDFLFYDSNSEKVFAKDLRQYDGTTLQYIGFMPKNESLNNYIENLTSEKLTETIGNLKDVNDIYSYKDGVVTKIYAYIPFFKYDYDMKNLKDNLIGLDIKDVFDVNSADLSNMVDLDKTSDNAYIMDVAHKADIDFSNDGIKAAAVTAIMGGMGAARIWDYAWDVPVEEIDLTFDNPFFFIIRDKTSGEVWFTGAVYNI